MKGGFAAHLSLGILLAGLLEVRATKLAARIAGTIECPPGPAPCKCNCAAAQQAQAASGAPGAKGAATNPMAMYAPRPSAALPPQPPLPPPPPPLLPEAPAAELPPPPAVTDMTTDDLPTLGPPPPPTLPPTHPPMPMSDTLPTRPPPPTQPPFPYAQARAALFVPPAQPDEPLHPHEAAAQVSRHDLGSMQTNPGIKGPEGEIGYHYFQYIPGQGYVYFPGEPHSAAYAGAGGPAPAPAEAAIMSLAKRSNKVNDFVSLAKHPHKVNDWKRTKRQLRASLLQQRGNDLEGVACDCPAD